MPRRLELLPCLLSLCAGCMSADVVLDGDGGESGSGSDAGADVDALATTTDDVDADECAPGQVELCDDPGSPVFVGVCRPAARVCDERGRWGACTGEVRPRVEDCATAVDEDCDGVAACDGAAVWVRGLGEGPGGARGAVRVHALAADAAGAAWVAGEYDGHLQLGGAGWTASGSGSYFLARLDGPAAVGVAFADDRPGAHARATALALAGDGRVAVAAGAEGQVRMAADAPVLEFGADVVAGAVTTLDAEGSYAWSRTLRPGAPGAVYVDALAFDATGAVWAAGTFGGSDLDVGAPGEPRVLAGRGGYDGVLMKTSADGEFVWARGLGDEGHQFVHALAIDAAGAVWLAGSFSGTLSFPGGSLSAGAGDEADMFVVKLDADGRWLWGRAYGDPNRQRVAGLSLDPTGGAVLIGAHDGDVLIFGDVALVDPAIDTGLVIAAFDADGRVRWARQWACEGKCALVGVAVDGAGQAVVSASLASGSRVTIDGETAQPPEAGGLVAKFDRDGAPVWRRPLPGGGPVAVGPTGEVFVAGSFHDDARFGEDPDLHLDAGGGDEDAFVLRLRP